MSYAEKVRETLLGLWWISWFGFIFAFVIVGYSARSNDDTGSSFCLLLVVITLLLWGLFFAVDSKGAERGRTGR